jgi:phosphoribosylaminoimidazole (AIR) synthetase
MACLSRSGCACRVLKVANASLDDPLPNSTPERSIGQALLEPTKIYVKQVSLHTGTWRGLSMGLEKWV